MRKDFAVLLLCLMFVISACKSKAPATKTGPEQKQQTVTQQAADIIGPKVEDEVFVYDRTNKRDPFVSLIVKEEGKPVKGDTPLESFDVGSIKVLGIVWNQKGHFAEVILPDGKAYTLKEGMTVGLHKGRVVRITQNSIVIKEQIKGFKGEMKPKETILKLREEEE